MKELTLYRCEICGNLICMIEDSGVIPVCCGKEMASICANTEDASMEKHVPIVKRDGCNVHVYVGDLPHPMTEKHYISRIILFTDKGVYMHCLSCEDKPETKFIIAPDECINTVYAWCNIHGLWMNEM